ncbi:type II secretion system minor pseudopilin GspJ [Acinetobacter genomosp. 15BJ]|uniref:Type II secretion system protein J n=1 Tax=Acinetobacter genomosp. 15BJ TaxID=106651 RepID=R9B666_9GAMM|nr:type II secretion system minor pseudopilin GspJ [Acinetobacter genomosp. 15BJ]EOR07861.1 type II secretion system protein J [Acinetobacter genomosp. 15BJ]MCH7291202.1 type II secretion system minor pseudopilin GspJ [Acinetobacter genomosp. 15BJ]MDO3658050.1 type II secretion system minor pseudopilin GspJ [Acinetobacter genomosp. 15BJ]
MKYNAGHRFSPHSGFTLVELLVAIAIFAVLSMLGWKVFDYLLKVKDRNAEHEMHLFALQDAYQQVLRDSLQIIPLTANDGRQLQAAIVLSNQSFSFSKAGVSDPLKQGLSPYERIEYRYDSAQKKVYRLKYSNLNIPNRVQPISSTLLENVDQFKVLVLNPQELTQWPENSDTSNITELKKLPLGIKIQLTVAGTDYEWIYSLLNTQAYLQSIGSSSGAGGGTNSPNNKDGSNSSNPTQLPTQ